MASALGQEGEVKSELQRLRDTPVTIVSDRVLTVLTNYLIGPPSKSGTNAPPRFEHWFCSRAPELSVETAKFLLRLHAYNSERVEVWRQRLRECLWGCCDCVRGFQDAKVSTRHTYFGAYSDDVLKRFYANFDEWELNSVLAGLLKAGFTLENEVDHGRTLSAVPPAISYHMFYNLHILQDSRIVLLIQSFPPKKPISAWPPDYPPPGLFYAVLHAEGRIRQWARAQIACYQTTPMLMESFLPVYCTSIKAISAAISGQAGNTPADTSCPFPVVQEPSLQWTGYASVLRFAPVELLRRSALFDVDLCQIVVSHLHDTGKHFVEVLQSFLLILTRIGSNVWEGEGPEYPQVVFNSIKDNVRYLAILQERKAIRRDDWILSWIETYLKTIGNSPIFNDILPTVIHFLCEQLQHERFKALRPAAMAIAARILVAVFSQAEKEKVSYQPGLVWEIIGVHSSSFISSAFARAYSGEEWTEARGLIRKVLKLSMVNDIKEILTAISVVSKSISLPSESWSLVVRQQIWKGVYESIQPGDSGGITLLVSTLAAIAHVDDFREGAFVDHMSSSAQTEYMKGQLVAINRSLQVVRSGFSDAVTRYLDLSPTALVVDLFGRPDVVKNVTILMLSPVEIIQETAQALVGSAFDVEVRLDCFRALFENSPEPTLAGICGFLETYVQYPEVVPEACSLSKALARCLTDVIDVLCSSPDGLLLDQPFLKDGQGAVIPPQLPRWWSLMTKALSVIFLRTPKWAIYFDNAEMILWMRDALIFGRDMLAQWRVIESGALAHSQVPIGDNSKKLSRIGKRMVNDLQPVLFEATRWLRLTDEELLHQSFALLESLLSCFRETNILPKAESLQKLQKHIDDARKNDPDKLRTRLDTTRLARLQDAISVFDDDDDIQIISHKLPEKQTKISSKTGTADNREKQRVQTVDVGKPSTVDERKAAAKVRPSGKKNTSNYFTAEDQKKLEATSAQPQFVRRVKPSERVFLETDIPRPAAQDASRVAKSVASEATSESDDSDDEGETDLASLSKLQRAPVIKKPVERRQVMRLDVPTRIQNPAIERMNRREDARRTQMRLKPDISSLHRTLLSWYYDHDGPNPPGEQFKLTAVPDKFQDFQHFRSVFEPMLLLECWTQLVESKEGPRDSYDCRIMSRQFVDDWVDLEISIFGSVKKDWNLSDADVVLLRHPSTKKCALGKAQSYRASPFGIQATIRCLARGSDPGLDTNSVWSISKVLSLTTLHREYAALMALPYYDMFETILQARVAKPVISDPSEVRKIMSTYNVNDPQAKAILYSLKANGFALIQGPPGTGKTSTICGLVHAFLSQRPRPVTMIQAGRPAGPADKEPVKKVLICAPSNAAIDEIAHRLKEGISGAGRRMASPKVVRVGNVGSMNVSVKDASLEHLIEQRLNADSTLGNPKDANGEITRLRAELESVKRLRQQKIEEVSNVRDNTARTIALEEEIRRLNKQKVMLTHQFDKLKDQQKSDSRTMDATRRRFRTEVLSEADVICSTLSGAAYEYLEQFDFELMIIDEAAQAIELSSLIPLKYRCNSCVMVGDPQQLPPTVKSQEACSFGYNQSLFVRLQRQRPDAVHLLSIQYRMHPDISQVPSRLFYDGKLKDGPDMAIKTARPWHSHEKLGTYHFFNVSGGLEETGTSHSFINRAECQVAVALYNRLRREFSSFDFDFKVGVVSMYRGQILEIRRAFEQRFGQSISGTVDFNTVDGFQGQEKDVIILSCVRAGPGVQSVGFLRDIRRMNVALTRAKASLFVLGHAATLERSDDTWRNIVTDARARSRLSDVDIAYFTTPGGTSKVISSPKTVQTKPSSKSQPKAQTKPQSQVIPSVPPDLATPRELKSTPVVQLSKAAGQKNTTPTMTTNSAMDAANAGQKRPAPADELDGGAQSRNVAPDTAQTRPRPPPKKRPKAGPSLFIPKNRRAPQ